MYYTTTTGGLSSSPGSLLTTGRQGIDLSEQRVLEADSDQGGSGGSDDGSRHGVECNTPMAQCKHLGPGVSGEGEVPPEAARKVTAKRSAIKAPVRRERRANG